MARDSGRNCGCDPSANHVCEEHAAARDHSQATCGAVEVTGPHDAGAFYFTVNNSGDYTVGQLSRFEVEDLIAELQRRLALRGN